MSDVSAAPRLRFWLLLLFSTAILLRLIYLLEMGSSFEFRRHEWKQTDMHSFHHWGSLIANGDWLSRHVSVPTHSWLLRIQSPEAWKTWLNRRFYQAPGYPYLIAVSLVFFNSLWPLVVLQMFLGLGILGLTYSIGSTLFSWRVGLLASILVLLYGPLLYHEPMLLRTATLTFLGLWLLWLAIRLQLRPSLGLWFLTGLVVAVAVLFKSTFLLVIPLLWVTQIRYFRLPSFASTHAVVSQKKLPASAVVFALFLGCGLGLAPLVARNVMVGISPLHLAANGGLVFVQGNAPDGAAVANFNSRSFREIFLKTQGRLGPTLRDIVAEHSVWSLLKLHLIRTWSVLRQEEVPNNTCYTLAQQRSKLLSLLRVDFLILVPLALLGCLLSFVHYYRTRWAMVVLFGFVLIHAASWIWGGHLMRYRIPIVPFIAIVAAYALHQGILAFSQKRWTMLGMGVSVVVGLALLINVPSAYRTVTIRTADYLAPMLHDIRLSRYQDACEVATLAAKHHPARFSSFSTTLCRCHQQQQGCLDQNCLGALWHQCQRSFFSLLKRLKHTTQRVSNDSTVPSR